MKTDSRFFCQICAKSFACSKSNHMGHHIGSQYHVKAANLKAPKQTTLIRKNSGNQVEDSFMLEFTDAWICAGLPLNALGDPKLKAVLEKGFKKPIPSVTLLAALSKNGCVNESDYGKLRLFLADAAAYNISASQSLVLTFPNLIHVTCISHMLARITSVLPKEAKVCKQLIKKFNQLFKSCITVLLWKGFEVRTADFVKNTVVVK